MSSVTVNSNERSEAIELIKHMEAVSVRNGWVVKKVGGENTVNTGKKRMFPDVYLFGDSHRTQVLQGWEVKMPDIPVTDSAFVHDAQRKADVLGVNSTFLWNFRYGVLYVRDSEGVWAKKREWDETSHIKTRPDVTTYQADWEALIEEILCELNNFFLSGELLPARLEDALSSSILSALIARNKGLVADELTRAAVADTTIDSHLNRWWRSMEKEYRFDEADRTLAYAKFSILHWANKLTFAHMMKRYHNPARAVESIGPAMTPAGALAVFSSIADECGFHNIFRPIRFGEVLPAATWRDFTDYNAFLTENGIDSISQEALQAVLEHSVDQFKRNIVGQFTTPPRLAWILARAALRNLNLPCIDPCCGTGSIAREVLAYKEPAIGLEAAYATTYASDKYSFPLQISNLSMTRVHAMGFPSRLFQSNLFELAGRGAIEIVNPGNGEPQSHSLPLYGSLVSNLPFVSFDQENREETGYIAQTAGRVQAETGLRLSRRMDLYQAALLDLWQVLEPGASVGVVTSNSWLGTLAGQAFFQALTHYYHVDAVVGSGRGKWFANADVVAVLLFLTKKERPAPPAPEHTVRFGLVRKALEELEDSEAGEIVDSIKLREETSPSLLSLRAYSIGRLQQLLEYRLALNAFFYDVDWLPEIAGKLRPVTGLFQVFRGIKTAQDEIYYFSDPAVVDPEYVGWIFKSAKSCKYLTASPDTRAFVCGKTLEELRELGHVKTLGWIERFAGRLNKSVPNKETFWMNLSGGRCSGSGEVRLFTGMNPDRRIFYGLLGKPAKINQRAIGFQPRSEGVDVELCHALLNSLLGIFYTEATGFPKGLAALDNCAENVKKLWMLDPEQLDPEQAAEIRAAFAPLCARPILPTDEEMEREDRIRFERTVLRAFGLEQYFQRILDAVLAMQQVRQSVRRAGKQEAKDESTK